MYDEYAETADALFASDAELERNFENSVFVATAINFSPNSVCGPHADDANRPDGLCAITALGPFNHKKGAQLVLDEAKIVLEFPSGTTAYIPSALVTHHNFPLQKGDKRYSVTQYTGGGIFRWVRNGFKSDKTWYEQASRKDIEKREQENSKRWRRGVSFFPLLRKS